uniref:hypothetical protein n=1 Tax=uncultured Sphingomonas sp. TaxID=158754 RepID=UPI0025D4C7A4|nr:hypothetical protein [uncultured Sphingomonas sp.]
MPQASAVRAQAAQLPPEGTEAAARLASIRQALRTADLIAGKPAADLARPVELTEVWPALPASTRRCFVARSERLANAALGGLELCGARPISPAAAEKLRDELRDGLAHIQGLFSAR